MFYWFRFVDDGIDRNPRNGSHPFADAQPRLRNQLVAHFDEYYDDHKEKRTTFMGNVRRLCLGTKRIWC